MTVSFQLIQEGPKVGRRWWLYPKGVRMQLIAQVLFFPCSFINSAFQETRHIFAPGLAARECCPLPTLEPGEACQAHLHGVALSSASCT